jgi:hypothetical protein
MNIKFLNALAMSILILGAETATASAKTALGALTLAAGTATVWAKKPLSLVKGTTGDATIDWNIMNTVLELGKIKKNCEYQGRLANEPQSPEVTERFEEVKAENALLIQRTCGLLETLPAVYRQRFEEKLLADLKNKFGVDVLAQCKEISQPK